MVQDISSEELGNLFAVAAATVQLLGYAIYVNLSLRGEIEPNPVTWIMFAYGTALLTFLEWKSGAQWQELLLPATCAASAIGVASIILLSGRLRLPEPGLETIAFALDVFLTLGYLALWQALQDSLIAPEHHTLGVLAFLLCANATTVTAFIPILRSTLQRPAHENFVPWVIWSIAYLFLLLATIRAGGGVRSLSSIRS